MLILLIFAFLAGIVTILSPCILPILPIVLSGSVGTGKRKPLGIITGFILSFTFFTLALSTIVNLTGISADLLRTFSVVILIVFGLSLLSTKFQAYLEIIFSKLANLTPKNNQNPNAGFFSGVLIGISLGLIWTPCVGPIIASVITLAATSSVNFASVLITLAYAIGTAIPMLIIMQGGRAIFTKVPWLLPNSGKIQKIFGLLMILTAIGIYFNIDRKFQTYILDTFPEYGIGLTQFEDNQTVKKELEKLNSAPIDTTISTLDQMQKPNAPEIIEGGKWFNSEPLRISELKGKVVLIDFWTYTCINCIRTLPYLKSWHEKYSDKGLVIIGIHTPEFEFEKNPENVQKAINDFEIKYPVIQDNDFKTWRAYNNRYWPAKYFIDKNGKVRSTHFGEGEYDESEKIIQDLLAETGTDVSEIEINNPDYKVEAKTHETYLGYGRIENFASIEKIEPDKKKFYTLPKNITINQVAYEGDWTVGNEYAMPTQNSKLTLYFDAKEVFLVMRTTDNKPGRINVLLDNKIVGQENAGEDVINGQLEVTTNKLYKIIELPTSGRHTLNLEFIDNNIEVYAFTFG